MDLPHSTQGSSVSDSKNYTFLMVRIHTTPFPNPVWTTQAWVLCCPPVWSPPTGEWFPRWASNRLCWVPHLYKPQPLGHLCCIDPRLTQDWVAIFPVVANPTPGKGIIIPQVQKPETLKVFCLITVTGLCYPSCWPSYLGLGHCCNTSVRKLLAKTTHLDQA